LPTFPLEETLTDFKQELRHRCRNPRCKSKLPAPVANEREAFCTKGCYGAFYRSRCVVCEEAFERKNEQQKVCGKRKCRSTLRQLQKADFALGRYFPRCTSEAPPEVPVNQGSAMAPADGRGGASIALDGAPLDHCAECGQDHDLVDHKTAVPGCWITLCCGCRDKLNDTELVAIETVPAETSEPWLPKRLAKPWRDKAGYRWQRMTGPNGETRVDDDWELLDRDGKLIARVRQEGGYWVARPRMVPEPPIESFKAACVRAVLAAMATLEPWPETERHPVHPGMTASQWKATCRPTFLRPLPQPEQPAQPDRIAA
jgi:hypothetical protein